MPSSPFGRPEFDPLIHAYRFFCPESGFVAVADADVMGLRVNPDWLLDWLCAQPVFYPADPSSHAHREPGVAARGNDTRRNLGSGRAGPRSGGGERAGRAHPSAIQISAIRHRDCADNLRRTSEHASRLAPLPCAGSAGGHSREDGWLALDHARLTARAFRVSAGGEGTREPAVGRLRPRRFSIFLRSAETRASHIAINPLKRQRSEVHGRHVFPVKRSPDTRRSGIYCRLRTRQRTRTRIPAFDPSSCQN